jgi:hypothetical protein
MKVCKYNEFENSKVYLAISLMFICEYYYLNLIPV